MASRIARNRCNNAERAVIQQLEAEGYKVLARGWPDLLAYRGDELRFIEVKPKDLARPSRHQRKLHRVLRSIGIQVEVIRPGVTGVTPRKYRKRGRQAEDKP